MSPDGIAVLYPAARWLGYLAAFLVIGATSLRWWLLPRLHATPDEQTGTLARRAIRIARLAAVGLALATLVRLYLQLRSLLEPDEAINRDLIQALVQSRWGHGWLAQGAAILITMFGWRTLGRDERSPAGSALALVGAIGLILASPLTGHAVGLPAAGRVGYPLAVVHFAAGAIWLGTLGVLFLVALRRPTADTIAAPTLVSAFSPLALAMGTAVMTAGTILAWLYVGDLDGLIGTVYGRVLLLKVAILSVVAATGAYNWRVVLPALRKGLPAPVARSAAIELVAGLALLAVTGVLVGLGAPTE